ncbi:MAG: hypothetical protein U1E73_08990 [Planctomycetota bacterium]
MVRRELLALALLPRCGDEGTQPAVAGCGRELGVEVAVELELRARVGGGEPAVELRRDCAAAASCPAPAAGPRSNGSFAGIVPPCPSPSPRPRGRSGP